MNTQNNLPSRMFKITLKPCILALIATCSKQWHNFRNKCFSMYSIMPQSVPDMLECCVNSLENELVLFSFWSFNVLFLNELNLLLILTVGLPWVPEEGFSLLFWVAIHWMAKVASKLKSVGFWILNCCVLGQNYFYPIQSYYNVLIP